MPTFSLLQRNADLDAHNAQLLARIALESTCEDPTLTARNTLSRLGDEKQLRGVPVQARGIGGAIQGTNPEHEATRDRRRPRNPVPSPTRPDDHP